FLNFPLLCQLSQLLFQLGAIRVLEIFGSESFVEKPGEFSAPLGMMGDDPVRCRTQVFVGSVEKWDDVGRLQVTTIHLVESDEGGALCSRIRVFQTGPSAVRVGDLDESERQTVLENWVLG